jgi:hypothetical protein
MPEVVEEIQEQWARVIIADLLSLVLENAATRRAFLDLGIEVGAVRAR